MKIKIIGAGGIGCYLIEPLIRYVSTKGEKEEKSEFTIIDGDSFEDRNATRQRFTANENKAMNTAKSMQNMFPAVHIRHKGEYITKKNVISTIREGDTIFLCVDNHATRKIVSDRCEELENVTLISGGNDYTDGNVILYRRVNGKDVGRSPTKMHPAIASPTDKNPGDTVEERAAGCQIEAQSAPQLLITNFVVAGTMLSCYYNVEQGKAKFDQVFFDIPSMKSRPVPIEN